MSDRDYQTAVVERRWACGLENSPNLFLWRR